jgi:hypothetical protein
MFLTKGFVVAAFLVACWDSSVRSSQAFADEIEVEENTAEAEEGKSVETGEGENAEGDEAKGQAFVDSAKELQDKLGQLKALLDAKGEGADPALKERLSGLEDQLKTLGLDGLTGGGASESNPALTEFLSGCVALAMRRVGIQRPATLGALRKLAEKKLPPAEAAKVELWRMVAVCVADFTEDEYADYKAGKMKMLPKALVDASKKPEAEQKVLEIEAGHWEELRKISAGLLKELVGDKGDNKPPVFYGLLAMIPLGLMIAFIAKLYRDMQKNQEGKKAKKDKKSK